MAVVNTSKGLMPMAPNIRDASRLLYECAWYAHTLLMKSIRFPNIMTGRRPYFTARPLVTKQDIPMAKMAHPRPALRELYDMPNCSAMMPKPGEIMGPHAPTTAVSTLIMRSRSSFFHCGQFNGSRGDSDGCGTRTISELRPFACFRVDVSRPGTCQMKPKDKWSKQKHGNIP